MVLTKSFLDQAALTGLTEGEAIDIDTELTLTLPGSSVYMFDGRRVNAPTLTAKGVYIVNGKKTIVK